MFTQTKELALLSVGSEARSRSSKKEKNAPLGLRPRNTTLMSGSFGLYQDENATDRRDWNRKVNRTNFRN